ncbi:unnamed protein product [Effrenium voratum]|uniref:Uncharacterized protein n=1 Tax=Effrenium voratum TaxID=2562239 RepID=A0AA36HXU8_9DINO|nr:unnamed protein product [Effrenium voratum]
MTAGDEDSVNEDEEEEEEEVWACLGPADLEADLAAAEPQAAELRRSLEVDIDFFTARHAADRKMASGLQRLCAEAELLQFNLASMVAKVAHGPLAPGPASWGPGSDVFGPEAQVPLPSLSLAVPGGSGLAEYLERLAALPRCVAVARDLHFAASKLDVRQDEKDINRDRLEVNGVEVFGAQGGYQAAVAAVVGALRAGDAAAGLPAWGEEATCAAQLLLSNLNRASGGRDHLRLCGLRGDPEVAGQPGGRHLPRERQSKAFGGRAHRGRGPSSRPHALRSAPRGGRAPGGL